MTAYRTASKADLAVFIGRFAPFHKGHLRVIREALSNSTYLVILIGSAEQARDWFVPFNEAERAGMILANLTAEEQERVIILPLLDYVYNHGQWVIDVQKGVNLAAAHFGLNELSLIMLVGHSKDKTSYYLKQFPQYVSMEVPNYQGISATPIRKSFFEDNGSFRNELIIDGQLVERPLPDATMDFLIEFKKTEDFADLVGEFQFIERYKAPYRTLDSEGNRIIPYDPIFTTVDACVVQSGHVPLVQRRARPGKGLWALPGGFVEQDEYVDDAVFRELDEESGIKVPEDVLRGSVVAQRKFDAPFRSPRGRIITFASLIHLKPMIKLPKVRGSEETLKAKWFPFADLKRQMFFEDHYHIVKYFQGLLDRKPE